MSEYDPVKRGIVRAIKNIREDAFIGRNVRKELIPRKLVSMYSLNNLWIYDLPNGWRLLYSLKDNEIELIAAVLDWMNHKDYERLFNF